MTALPRGTCATCFADVPVRRNGVTREHRRRTPIGNGTCPGAGKPPLPTPPAEKRR